jgi:parallel beta-helix repeat protein
MELHWSSNNTLISNNCSSNGNDGIYLGESSNNNTLVSNRGFWNVYNGIDVVSSRDNMLVSNTWSSNGYHGAYIGYSTNNTLDSNNCSSNNLWGIQIRDSSGNLLLRNQLCDNLQYGVYIYSASSSNIVFNNTFIGNNGAGSTYDPAHAQAYDEGTGNWWNSTDGYGNYWSDWITPDVAPPDGIVDVPYDIAGSAGAKDYYPQTTPQAQIPEFGMMPLVVMVLLVAILLARNRSRKNP